MYMYYYAYTTRGSYNFNDVSLMARGKVQRSVACANAQTTIVHSRNAQTDSDCSCRRLAASLLNSRPTGRRRL